MATVKGFGVCKQTRRRVRSELSGEYEGRKWFIRCEHSTLFFWTIDKMSGYAGPTLADVLRTMKKASRNQTALENLYGEVSADQLRILDLLLKWERRAVQGRLSVVPFGSGDKRHYRVREKVSG